jgi:hypothetical protein
MKLTIDPERYNIPATMDHVCFYYLGEQQYFTYVTLVNMDIRYNKSQ